MGGKNYEFKPNNTLTYNFKSDIAKFDRHGKYTIVEDTIFIEYEPFIETNCIGFDKGKSSFQFKNKNGTPLQNCTIELFINANSEIKEGDENGLITITEEFQNFDSIYLNWDFLEFKIYSKEHKLIPKIDKINGYPLQGFLNIEVILEEDLIGHLIKSNKTAMLIIGRNQIFNGLDYRKNHIYPFGILEKNGSK